MSLDIKILEDKRAVKRRRPSAEVPVKVLAIRSSEVDYSPL